MRTLFLIALTLLCAGCAKDPVAISRTDNSDIAVSTLFTHDGVTVYRFTDDGRYVYFTNRVGTTSFSHTESSGKTVITVPDRVENR